MGILSHLRTLVAGALFCFDLSFPLIISVCPKWSPTLFCLFGALLSSELLLHFMCCEYFLCMYVCITCVPGVSGSPEKGVRSPGGGATDSCDQPHRSHLCPLKSGQCS